MIISSAQHWYCCKWGWTLKLRLFASLYFSSGRRVSIWLFVVNFNFIFSIGQQFRAGRTMNSPPAAIPARQTVKKLSFSYKTSCIISFTFYCALFRQPLKTIICLLIKKTSFILTANHFQEDRFINTNYFVVVWCPIADRFQHFIKAQNVFGPHKIVTKHDEIHFPIYFLQAF